MNTFGAQDMSAPLHRVMMRRPGPSLSRADPRDWNYGSAFDAGKAMSQYDSFTRLIERSKATIAWIDDAGDGLADAMFTHDPSLVLDRGALILRMGKTLRAPETLLHESKYRELGIPILGRIEAPGTVEGGDCLWLDQTTLIVGRGVRTNQQGIDQIASHTQPLGIELLQFDLPLWQGERACLHLLSVMSPLASNLALVFAPLLPVPLYQLLRSRGVVLIEAPVDEFHASNGLSLNVLPTQPRELIMVAGFPKTQSTLEAAGCRVDTFEGDALCVAYEGGPTCLTRPLLRRAR
jgi:N-dimethylarginine dimethylaminohydrolase